MEVEPLILRWAHHGWRVRRTSVRALRRRWSAGLALLATIVSITFAAPVCAELRLPAIFSDGAVLQRDEPLTIWGWDEPGATVTVTLGEQQARGAADASGRWSVELAPLSAGGPIELSVRSSTDQTLIIGDILIGEVWLCAGQSNMTLSFADGAVDIGNSVASARYPRIRLFNVPRAIMDEPLDDLRVNREAGLGVWRTCTPETAGHFPAVGFYFGRELHEALDVPIGLIHSSFGGTRAESWTARDALERRPSLKPLLDRWDADVNAFDPDAARAAYERQMTVWRQAAQRAEAAHETAPPEPRLPENPAESKRRPSVLYNGMIAPLTPYTLAGVILYQGESNVVRAFQYRTLFPALIESWRTGFHAPDLPIYFVQIAPYAYGIRADPQGHALPELREGQLLAMKQAPHTGMVVIHDTVDDPSNLHPPRKDVVGHRLALWALSQRYHRAGVVYSGPIYKDFAVHGDQIVVRFEHVGSGLASSDGEPLTEFQIAGEDRMFHPAEARIDGNTVAVHSDVVARPVAVRLGWRDLAQPNLINREGLPASPFRTDTWPAVTEGRN